MKRLKLFFSWLYTLNHPMTDEYPLTTWEYLYKCRIGFGTAWRLSKIINETLKQKIQTV